MTYDANGNMTRRNVGDTFQFDRANRMTSASLGGSSYQYDGFGRRYKQTTSAGAEYTFYSQDGKVLFGDSRANQRYFNYIYLGGSLVAKRTVPDSAPTEVFYQHTDALGSPVAFTDSQGVVLRRERLTAYGDVVDGTWKDGHGFTGHQMDRSTELVYMQQRYYDPTIGRFLSVDPVGPLEGPVQHFGRYHYASNNPYKYIDPDGRISYLASRPLQMTDAASHNYIATNADYVGDPDATIYSYGDRGDGITGRVTSDTQGPAAGTYDADVKHWKSLSLDLAEKSASKIDATDAEVADAAEAVLENKPYAYVPALTKDSTNSNSAASAVANKAAGSPVPVPDGNRVSPGAEKADRVEFEKQEKSK
jgi:RHS repeat-associated protein